MDTDTELFPYPFLRSSRFLLEPLCRSLQFFGCQIIKNALGICLNIIDERNGVGSFNR